MLAGGALACFAGPGYAQAQVSDSAQTSEDEVVVVTGRYTIDERIDTATGLGLTLRETPQSVTVITQQRITDQNLGTIADVVRNTAGVSMVEVDDVRNVFNARGFEITNYQIDGVPLSWSLAGDAAETLADVSMFERVEFVRGATGLLTGAGDPSASINLVRKHADAVDLEGYVSGSLGTWENRQIEGDIAGALTQSGGFRGRLVAKYEERAQAFLRRRFPALADQPLLESRVCQVAYTASEDFIIDRHPDNENVWLMAGDSGHAFKHAPRLGQDTARRILGRASDESYASAFTLRAPQE